MPKKQSYIILADDDPDDCFLFKEALEELHLDVKLVTMPNGEMLMLRLHKLDQLPDMLFLDLNMPRKNGMECLIEMKQNDQLKAIPVIIFSTSFEPVIADLLYENGAQYCIKKPVNFSQYKEVIYCAFSLTQHDLEAGHFSQPAKANFILTPESCSDETPETPPNIVSDITFPVVGVGASAGGLTAFKRLLKAIPKNSGMAYVLVQHLDPNHESLLPELLQKATAIPVEEIKDEVKVLANHIYIIPSNKMLKATDGILQLMPRPERNKNQLNLPIDLFFTSLAEVHQEHAIGVVLSGTGSDGTLGLKAIKDFGGMSFAQNAESAEFNGMPLNALHAGVVDFVLSPEEIIGRLLEIKSTVTLSDNELLHPTEISEDSYRQIIALLRLRRRVDFTHYKQTTIRRRILRRMTITKNDDPAQYLTNLRASTVEQDALFNDLLIPVTQFFRDHKVFDNLCSTVFPSVMKNKKPEEPIRMWVAGCSTGEEAYSIAMCLREFLESDRQALLSETRVQIFATDISEPAIAKARRGIYSKEELKGLSNERLQKHLTKIDGVYRVNKEVKNMCVFAVHNFLKDPPFGKVDCITCRNVLIYMEPYLQTKALTTFHYALNEKGILLLGKSETANTVADLFLPATNTSDKIFTRRDAARRFMPVTTLHSEQSLTASNIGAPVENVQTDFQKAADDIMLSKYTPAGVVVNEALDVVYFRGNTADFLGQRSGKPTHNLMKLGKEDLAFELRNLLQKVKKENVPGERASIVVRTDGSKRSITIEAIPLPNMADPHYLILFHEFADQSKKAEDKTPDGNKDAKELRIEQLEKELAQTHEDMRIIAEEQDSENEELQSMNEELLSGNEELQTLNEELQTSQEELQSTNEELSVVNQEMLALNEQLTEARDYSEAIVATVREPLLVLDKSFLVKMATLAFYNFLG